MAKRLAGGLDFHLKLFASFDGLGEACHDLRNLLEVLEADDFDGRVHVAVRQADEAAGNAAACPEDRIDRSPTLEMPRTENLKHETPRSLRYPG